MKSAHASRPILAILSALFMVLFGYQNCAPVEFAQDQPTYNEKGQPDEDLVMEPVPDDKKNDGKDKDDGKDYVKNPGKDKGKKSCKKTACGDFSDIELTVVALEINNSSGKMSLVPVKPLVVNLDDLTAGIEFELDQAISISQIRLVLSSENYLLDEDGKRAFALKTPSGQQSGVKLLTKFAAVQPGVYKVRASIDLERQIVSAGKKCIFKPVVHGAKVVHMDLFGL